MTKKVLKTACLVLMGLVLLFNLLTIALSSLELRERLNWLPGAFLTVESGSMEPVLSEGDLLFVWETPYEELKVGDTVTFHGNNELVTHRIVREDGSRFVTRGMANNVEDPSIGPEEYCAKVALVFPGAGAVLEILTTPVNLALISLLVLMLLYGGPILRWAKGVMEHSGGTAVRPGALRLTTAGAVISLFCLTPFMTAAKYTANINEYASVSANATYFSSNYLSEEGNIYYIQGWNGVGYGISLYIRNYENDLLFNRTGHDVQYQIEFKKISETEDGSESYEMGYDLTLSKDGNDQSQDDNGVYGPYRLDGNSLKGGETHFEVALATKDEEALPGGTKIRFQIIASTVSDTDFSQSLLGDFSFEATDAKSFLGEYGPQAHVGSALVIYSLKTELVEGATTRDIKVTWDNTKMYLNEFEATAANIITNSPGDYVPNDGNGRGSLTMSLHAYSRVNLQFFKYDPNASISASDFTCAEVEPESAT